MPLELEDGLLRSMIEIASPGDRPGDRGIVLINQRFSFMRVEQGMNLRKFLQVLLHDLVVERRELAVDHLRGNGLKLDKETTLMEVRWTRVEGTARDAASTRPATARSGNSPPIQKLLPRSLIFGTRRR